MFLPGEVFMKTHLFISFFLFGLEALLTVFMFIYMNKKERIPTSEDNILVKTMLAASRVQ